MKKKREYMPPRFMSVSEASEQLLKILEKRKETGYSVGIYFSWVFHSSVYFLLFIVLCMN